MASSQTIELVEIRSFGKSCGSFKEKEILSVEEIYHSLLGGSLNKAGVLMRANILQTRSETFLHLPVEFSISGLQHCTDLDSTRKILESQSFIGREHEREELRDLSFWSVDVPSTDIEKAREDQIPPHEAREYKEKITQQFANSPAFNKLASRYGNFRFSFQFSDLLSVYEAQFCEGEEPQLSIMGTDIYKQEIAHYVVVHSPDSTRFKDHPRVKRLQNRCDPLPSVFLLGDTLYWRPESTSHVLKVRTKYGHLIAGNQQEPCLWPERSRHSFHKIPCAWNHLVIAFHIPQGGALKIPVEKLIDHVSTCSALDPFQKENSRITKTEAEIHIKVFQQQYLRRGQKLRPKVDSSHEEQFGKDSDPTPLTERNIYIDGKEQGREAELNEKPQDCGDHGFRIKYENVSPNPSRHDGHTGTGGLSRNVTMASTTGNKEVTVHEINNSTLQKEQFLDCQKQLLTCIENLGKNLSEGFHSLCQELRNVTSAITSFQMGISRGEHRPPSSIETNSGPKTGSAFTLNPSSSLRSDGRTTTSRVVDGLEEDCSQGYGEQKTLLTEDGLENQMDGAKPAEEVEVGEQPSTRVRVKKKRTGGSVTGKHAADTENKRGGPHQKPSMRTDSPNISTFFRSRPRVPAEEVEVGEQPSTPVRLKQKRNGGSVTRKHAAERVDPRELKSAEQCGPPLKKKK